MTQNYHRTEKPQHRYEAFKKYEVIIAKFVTAYPDAITFKPGNYSTETIVNRVRDATNAFLRNEHWESDLVDRVKLKQIWADVSCSVDGDKVRIGHRRPKGPSKNARTVEFNQIETPKVKELVVWNPSEAVFKALVILHSAGVLNDPTRLKELALKPEEYPIPENVEIFPQGEDYILL